MAQPPYVPTKAIDVTRIYTSPPRRPDGWRQDRPAELLHGQERGERLGSPGPDQGFALTLAESFRGKLALRPGEHEGDAIAGCLTVALKRASLFGRAPVIHDVEAVMALLGYDGSADPEFAQVRTLLVHEAGHDYRRRRALVDAIPESLMRRKPDEIGAEIYEWRREARERLFPELRRQPTM